MSGHLPQPHFQAIGEMVWQLLRVQTVTSAARKLAVPSEHCHMTTVKPNCVMHWTVMVSPIPFQQRLLDHASIGTLHDDCCLNNLYFTSVVEPKANSCFHEQESLILTAEKIVNIMCTNLVLTDPMRYCNYCDVISVYSLNSQKLPGCFSYSLGMGLYFLWPELVLLASLFHLHFNHSW